MFRFTYLLYLLLFSHMIIGQKYFLSTSDVNLKAFTREPIDIYDSRYGVKVIRFIDSYDTLVCENIIIRDTLDGKLILLDVKNNNDKRVYFYDYFIKCKQLKIPISIRFHYTIDSVRSLLFDPIPISKVSGNREDNRIILKNLNFKFRKIKLKTGKSVSLAYYIPLKECNITTFTLSYGVMTYSRKNILFETSPR